MALFMAFFQGSALVSISSQLLLNFMKKLQITSAGEIYIKISGRLAIQLKLLQQRT